LEDTTGGLDEAGFEEITGGAVGAGFEEMTGGAVGALAGPVSQLTQ
jgi:hypothetical protein